MLSRGAVDDVILCYFSFTAPAFFLCCIIPQYVMSLSPVTLLMPCSLHLLNMILINIHILWLTRRRSASFSTISPERVSKRQLAVLLLYWLSSECIKYIHVRVGSHSFFTSKVDEYVFSEWQISTLCIEAIHKSFLKHSYVTIWLIQQHQMLKTMLQNKCDK